MDCELIKLFMKKKIEIFIILILMGFNYKVDSQVIDSSKCNYNNSFKLTIESIDHEYGSFERRIKSKIPYLSVNGFLVD